MARFAADYAVGKPDEYIRLIAEDYLKKEGFKPVLYKGEWMWKKGEGFLTAPQYVKIAYGAGVVHVEAFLRYAILPGVFVGEMGLNGAWGFLVKDMLRAKVDGLVRLLYQPMPGEPVSAAAPPPPGTPVDPRAAAVPAAGAPIPAAAAWPGGDAASPVPAAASPVAAVPAAAAPAAAMAAGSPAPTVYPAAPGASAALHNPVGKAKLGFAFGLCGLTGCFLPLPGLVFSLLGLFHSRVGLKSTSRGLAVAGMVLSIVFLVVSIGETLAWFARMLLWLVS